TVGASGAIFGLFGALLVVEYFATGRIVGSQAFGLIAINLVFSFTFSGISWGGHIGGLVGGIPGTVVLARFGRRHAAYGRAAPAALAAARWGPLVRRAGDRLPRPGHLPPHLRARVALARRLRGRARDPARADGARRLLAGRRDELRARTRPPEAGGAARVQRL